MSHAALVIYGMPFAARLGTNRPVQKHIRGLLFFGEKMAVSNIEVAADAAIKEDESCPNWTRRDRLVLEGLRYDVYVAAHSGGYWGVWACLECGDHGASLLNDSTPDAASTRAQLGLNEHHNRFHRGPRKPK